MTRPNRPRRRWRSIVDLDHVARVVYKTVSLRRHCPDQVLEVAKVTSLASQPCGSLSHLVDHSHRTLRTSALAGPKVPNRRARLHMGVPTGHDRCPTASALVPTEAVQSPFEG